MRVRIAILVVWLSALIQSNDSRAQALDGSLQTFTKSDFYKGLISRALAAIPPTVFQRCPTMVSNGSTVTVVRPISFGPNGFPNAGVWKQSFPVSGCGNDTILNFFFVATADEKIHTLGAYPGTTYADLRLQQDALLYVRGAAKAAVKDKDCKLEAFQPKNTKFEGFDVSKAPIPSPGPYNGARPWRETWTMIGCNQTIDVPVFFFPDEKGTRIFAGGAIER